MTLNGYFMSKSVFMPAVLLRAFEDRRTQSATKMMKANVVPKSIRSVRIFAGVPYTGALNVSVVFENRHAQPFPSKFPTLKLTLLYSYTLSLVGFSVIP